MLYYGVYKDSNEEEHANLYYGSEGLQLFFKDTFRPGSEVCLIGLGGLKGKSYKEKKEAARNKAIEYSLNIYPGLSWGECSEIQSYFENIGKRYGLLKEFRANAII